MKSVPIPFGSQSYRSDSLPWNAQRCVNWFAESAPPAAQSKTPFMLRPRPGLLTFATIVGPCRGHHTMAGILYGVYGSNLVSITNDGTVTALGMILGVQSVSMADNGVQLTVVASPNGWVYDNSTAVFAKITDPDFPGSQYVTQLNGYFIHVVPGNSGEIAISNLNDGLAFDALDFADAEASGDPLVAAFSNHGELWLFGTETIEPWGNSGSADFPFSPIQSAKIERGCAAPFSISLYDNTVVWVGDDRIVYRASGYTPQRISTHPIEQLLQQTGNLLPVQGSWHTVAGHSFYMMKNPGVWCFLYDAATGLWHENTSFGENFWDYGYPVGIYNEVYVGGDNGNLFQMDANTRTDNGNVIPFDAISPPLYANDDRIEISRLQLGLEVGVGLNTGQGSDPQAILSWSKDGGKTWSNEHWRSMGRIGEYKRRVIWRQLGQAFEWVFRLQITDPVKPIVTNATANISVTPA